MANQVYRQSLAQKVATSIQEQISLGEYKPGDKLPTEPDLMKYFGVGRSTIREAVKILAHSGLVRVRQGIGTFITEYEIGREPLLQRLNRAHIEEIEEVRRMLDIKIAEKAALCRTERDIARMKNFLRLRLKMAMKGELDSCVDADVKFHICIAEASGNSVMADLYKTLSRSMRLVYSNAYSDTRIYMDTQDIHDELLKCIVNQDPEDARLAASKIISHT